MTIKITPFQFQPFSKKQLKVLTWWLPESPVHDKDTIIADGSVRSGKTVSMSLSFVQWSMHCFDGENFGMAGKTIGAFRRNVLSPLKRMLTVLKYRVTEHRADNMLEIGIGGRRNFYYLFGGKDESSQDLIQGVTLAGMLFDEVALMPQSFVNQATARCSAGGARMWFNCNPEGPSHWFYLDYLDKPEKSEEDNQKAREKNALYLHFVMDDNLSLPEAVKERYRRLYTGVFYDRYIRGEWAIAQGAVYKNVWSEELMFDDAEMEPGLRNNKRYSRYILADYGTVNPAAYLDIIDDGEIWWAVDEFYYDSKKSGVELTPGKLADKMMGFIGAYELKPRYIVVDPSAAGFKAELRERRLLVKEIDEEIVSADNRVLDGIQNVATALQKRLIRIHRRCKNLKRELLSYVWDDSAIQKGQKERPLKQNDHTCDALRYGVQTLMSKRRLLK